MYLGLAFNVEKDILKYCSMEVSELVRLVLLLRRNWKGDDKEVEYMGVFREDGKMLAPWSMFSECELCTQYTPLVGSANQ